MSETMLHHIVLMAVSGLRNLIVLHIHKHIDASFTNIMQTVSDLRYFKLINVLFNPLSVISVGVCIY